MHFQPLQTYDVSKVLNCVREEVVLFRFSCNCYIVEEDEHVLHVRDVLLQRSREPYISIQLYKCKLQFHCK